MVLLKNGIYLMEGSDNMTKEEQLKMLSELVTSSLHAMKEEPVVGGTVTPLSSADGTTSGSDSDIGWVDFDSDASSSSDAQVTDGVSNSEGTTDSNVIPFPGKWSGEEQKQIDEAKKNDAVLRRFTDDMLHRVLPYLNKTVKRKEAEAFNSKKSDRHAETVFAKDTCMVGGQPFNFQRVMQVPDWSIEFGENTDNGARAENLDKLRVRLTETLGNYFGGWHRIKSIVVNADQLIINGVCYMPKLTDATIEKFPFDSADYVKNGCIAPFFIWSILPKCKNLQNLSFDNPDFVLQSVAQDLGVSARDFDAIIFFNICKNLMYLEIGDASVTYQDLVEAGVAKKSASDMRKKLSNCADNMVFYDKFKETICDNGVSRFRGWTFNNMVNYANNRGDKNFFWYSGGVVARAGLSLAAGTVELGTRLAGFTTHKLTSVFRNALRPEE